MYMDKKIIMMEMFNIPTFGPNTYRHVSIDYDDYLDVLFYIGLKNTLHMNMVTCFIYIGHNPIIDDICICLFMLVVDPEAHDSQDVLC